ncbi:MAG TPA: type II secretion system protein [Gemmatimonadaceae bacterium]|nr:type II secretion system protein [Gemmatimonadaceae bacterium]
MRRVRNGFALVAALLAIVLIGALVAGVLFATTEDTKAGTTSVARDLALIAAESALARVVADARLNLPTDVGVASTTSSAVDESGVSVLVYMTRLDSAVYSIVADAQPDRFHSGARRRVALLVTARARVAGSLTVTPIPERPWSELF